MTQSALVVGRYTLFTALASGGMATVHLGRLSGEGGFSRTVAIKRLHPQLAADASFAAGFMDEARLAGRIRHPNVVSVIDVVASGSELLLVMEYVHGETLSRILRHTAQRGELLPPRIAAAIACDMLEGLHAAHEARDERGAPLDIVHRDVSPQNVIIGADGIARVLDFGIAKAAGRLQETREGQLKGKLSYMAPEQLDQEATRSTDIYAASVVLWEMLTCQRLQQGATEAQTVGKILAGKPPPPSSVTAITSAYDEVVLRALASRPSDRFATARDMALAVARCGEKAEHHEVAEWLERTEAEALKDHSTMVAAIESAPSFALQRAPAVENAQTSAELTRDALPSRRRSPSLAIALVAIAVLGVVAFGALRDRIATPPHTATTAPLSAPSSSSPAPSETAPVSTASAPVIAPSASVKPQQPTHATSATSQTAKPAPTKLPDFL